MEVFEVYEFVGKFYLFFFVMIPALIERIEDNKRDGQG